MTMYILTQLNVLALFSGAAGDSLSGNRGYPFTTKDQDNDRRSSTKCAMIHKRAWWYTACSTSNLKALYNHGNPRRSQMASTGITGKEKTTRPRELR